ncbi:hypothetical protein, conserved [Plasmodium gonderi]|uniref:Sulfhydryl oxidase n=1 Tax=Plasmodium gonderi TaxID=77519 RepID=A0A1Y1JQK9_PLAGO|nr:hypothetical protein, conserved [Plasmodium gonderi]GAW83785.1 hypothetical protein, conserved [Plasmodium gonderi]
MVRLSRSIFKILILTYNIVMTRIQFSRSEDVCKGAEETLKKFGVTINNAKHGDAILISIKNYYCPACSRYMDIWENLEKEISNYEKHVSMFAFDCSCHLFVSYCRFFNVRYFPTFRLLYPVYDYMEKNKFEYKYITPKTQIANTIYENDLLLAYTEVDRVNNVEQFQRMIQTYLCKNVNFNHIDLKSCYVDLPTVEYNPEYNIFIYTINPSMDEGGIVARSNQYAVQRWAQNNISNDDIKHDIIKGILFTLKKHISLGLDVDRSTVEPFLVIIQIVSDMYPELSEWSERIYQKVNSQVYPLTYQQWSSIVNTANDDCASETNPSVRALLVRDKNDLENGNPHEEPQEQEQPPREHTNECKPWENPQFKVCEENSILCSYWLLYHKISVHCLVHDKERYNFYLKAITNYTKNYLNCENCIEHFVNAQKSCYYGFCNIHSAESFVIFLWRIHNSVTLRSMYESIVQEAQIQEVQSGKEADNKVEIEMKKKFLNKDIVFPPEANCKNCRMGGIGFTKITSPIINNMIKEKFISDRVFDAIDGFSVKNVLNYLIRMYS